MGRNRDWTEEEVRYLEDRWGSVSIKGIAKGLNRSIYAVKSKATRLGLGDPRMHYDGITVHQLILVLGVSYSTIRLWIQKYRFPVKQKLFAEKEKVYVITYEDFWEWAEKNKQFIGFSKIERNILGPEPEWVEAKRRADQISCRKMKPWTKEDDEQLINMVRSYQYTYPEIAKSLNRTEGAVKRRLSVLGIKYRAVWLINNITSTQKKKLK